MSDFAPLSTPAPISPADQTVPTAGLLLRRARQSAGLHAEALAAALKVPVQKIEALEADRFDLLPDLVFVRALAATICRTLGVDAQPVLERLPCRNAPRLAQDRDRVNAPFRGSNDVPTAGWRDRFVRPPVLAMVALLIGALVLVLLPQSLLDEVSLLVRSRLSETPGTVVVLAPESAPVASAAPAAVAPALPAEAAPAAPLAANSPVAASGPVTAAVMPVMAVSTASASPVTQSVDATVAAAAIVPSELPAAEPAAPVAGVLVFRARGDSWVEVRDAQGAFALRRMLAAGETADASGAPPLSVTVGKADVTQVQVRGKDFDLAAVARDNVARFQVK